ncbi:MAG: class I SAM-dependent methyltransferase [Gemmatimonadaceae bacterium]
MTAIQEALTTVHRLRSTCRSCGEGDLSLVLSLGSTPLANSFLRSRTEFETEKSFPLDLYYCETCSLVQLLDVIDPEVLFRNYIYVTGTSDTIAAHNVRYADTIAELLQLGPADLVVEVASNDGSLLRCFKKHHVRTLGIEPATNIADQARAVGVETLNRFFDRSTARDVRDSHGPAKALIGNNVLAHVDEVRSFLSGCRDLLTHDGLAIFEVPYLGEMLERLEYDTIYHEHLSYFSITALLRLCDYVGLSVVRIDRVPVHGGSIRVYAARREHKGEHAGQVLEMSAGETADGLTSRSRYDRFGSDVAESRRALVALLENLRSDGETVAGYGAPAKGNTLLNYCGIDVGQLPYTVDKNPLKVGMYTPGSHIPVLPVSTILERRPDYVLLLAWNFADEIMRQQQAYRDLGGRFIVPVPRAAVVE